MRLGRVEFRVSYVVDLDDVEMIDRAQDAIYDDIWHMGKDSEIDRHIRVVAPDQGDTPDDIPEFLRDATADGEATP